MNNIIPSEIIESTSILLMKYGVDFRDLLSSYVKAKDLSSHEEWIDLETSAEIAGVSVYTVRRWLKEEYIEGIKLNPARCGRIRILKSSLISFLQSRRIGGAA